MKAPIRKDQYLCPECDYLMINRHPRGDKSIMLVTCHNCRREYEFTLIEQLGRYEWKRPAKEVPIVEPEVLASPPAATVKSVAIIPDAAPSIDMEDNGVLNPPRRGPGRPRKNPA